MNIAMMKKEIKIERHKFRSSSFQKFNNKKNDFSFKNKFYSNKQPKIEDKDNFKYNRSKSNFKEKKENNKNNKIVKDKMIINENSNTPNTGIGRTKYNSLILDMNKMPINNMKMNKTLTKNKKKKKHRKSTEKIDENNDTNKEKRHSSINLESKDLKKKKKKKKKIRRKSMKKDSKDKDIKDKQNSPNIIILDFSSSNNSDISESSSDNTFEKKDKNKIEKEEFLTNKQTTIFELSKKREVLPEKKFVEPKSKNSCFVGTRFKMSHTKVSQKLTKRKFTTNNILITKTKINIKLKSKTQNNVNNKEKEKCFMRESFKENKDKEKRKKEKLYGNSRNIYNEDKFDEKPTKIMNSLSKKIPLHNNNKYTEKKSKYKKQKTKESFNSCKNLKKNINQMIENVRTFKGKTENYSNMYLGTNSLNNTPKSKPKEKNAYNSNRNLAKIAINPVAGENKDIHLVLDGKEETIINYTNQEMVDDENEYMVECLKVLLKLNMEEQPRCKQKVNFNFPKDGKNKKIALFDLDETLVHCTKDKKGINGDIVNIKLPTNKIVAVGLNIRSNWKEALDLIKVHYHIVVYTASHQSYADAVLNYLDKENKYFQYRLYRNHCVQCNVEGIKFYVKDLDTLNEYYNLKDVVLIDNSVLSFAYHLNNGIPIVPFIEQQNDTQLLMLAYYLVSIANFDDLTQENKKHINIEHFLLMAKKLSEEESEEEDDKEDENITENNNIQEAIKDNKNEINAITFTNKETKDTNDKSEINNDDLKTHKTTTKSVLKNSEKALKIAEDMKKNIDDIYKNNYNEKE
jgi:CTD small phosphatase-like protein 2